MKTPTGMHLKRISPLIPALAMCAWLLGGCGPSNKPSASETPQGGAGPAVVDKDIPLLASGEADPIADPAAKRGGTYTTWGGPYPKSLNMWLDYNSFSADVMGMLFESLVGLHSVEEKPVGQLAESWEISPDGKTFTFKIHPTAAWSDGKPVTAADVQFYYDTMMNPKHLTPIFRVGLKRFARPEIVDDKTVRIVAVEDHWQNFWEAAGLVAFPKHAWEGKDFNTINSEFPVVSGPYELAEAKTNRYVLLKRRGDWWGKGLKYNAGKFNFDYIRYRSSEDREKTLDVFKKGELDVYGIYTAKIWAQQTDFSQIQKGWIVKQVIRNKNPIGFQGFGINMRRETFKDKKVREALCYLLDRKLMNEKLMFNEYFLLNSFFPDLYEQNRNPAAPEYGYDPEKARALLAEAGWTVNSRGILEKEGKPLVVTFLFAGDDMRHLNIYLESLKAVGIDARIDQISQASFRKRLDQFDYDLAWMSWGAGRLRDPESMWDSSQVDQPASQNLAGVADEQIDALIRQQKTEMDLAKRNDILRKLDTRLTEIVPYVLLWQSDAHRVLYWDKFGMPKNPFGKYGGVDSVVVYWWFDAAKEKALNDAMKSNRALPIPPAEMVYSE